LKVYPGLLPAFSIMLGPLPAPDIDAFIEQRSQQGGMARRPNDEEVLGRNVEVVEIRSDLEQVTKLWIDDEYNFILRYEATSPEMSIVASVESIEFGAGIPDERLTFVPPQDAIERQSGPSSSQRSGFRNVGNWNMAAPEGFLLPDYVPAGYVTKGTGEGSDASGRITSHRIQLTYDYAADPTLFINQQRRAGGLPEPIPGAHAVDIAGTTGYRTTQDKTETLTFSRGDVVVTLSTTTLAFDELRRIAESMQ
jgi:hypothetical protein